MELAGLVDTPLFLRRAIHGAIITAATALPALVRNLARAVAAVLIAGGMTAALAIRRAQSFLYTGFCCSPVVFMLSAGQ